MNESNKIIKKTVVAGLVSLYVRQSHKGVGYQLTTVILLVLEYLAEGKVYHSNFPRGKTYF